MANNTARGAVRREMAKRVAAASEDEAELTLCEMRYKSRDEQVCPQCGHFASHYRIKKRRQWRCRSVECSHTFSVTSGTKLDNRKLSFRQILRLWVAFESSPKGTTLAKIANDVGVTEKTAQQNLMKIREAIMLFSDRSPLEGLVHVDGAHFCGKLRRSNRRLKATSASVLAKHGNANVRAVARKINERSPGNRRRKLNQRVVMAFVEVHSGSHLHQGAAPPSGPKGSRRVIVASCYSENAANAEELARMYVKPGTMVFSDENPAYTGFAKAYGHRSVNHSTEYCTDDGVNENLAESFFSRMRRAQYGVHHGFRADTLEFYAWESAWRENHRHHSQSEAVGVLGEWLLTPGYSNYWRGYHGGNSRKDTRNSRPEIVMARPPSLQAGATRGMRMDP